MACDDVVERFQVLDVDGADDVDAGLEERFDVLPALLVLEAGRVRVRQFVDQRHLWCPVEYGRQVHFGQLGVAVMHRSARNDFQPVEQRCGVRPVVGLDEADDHVGAACCSAAPFVEHGVGLAHAWRAAEIDA